MFSKTAETQTGGYIVEDGCVEQKWILQNQGDFAPVSEIGLARGRIAIEKDFATLQRQQPGESEQQ